MADRHDTWRRTRWAALTGAAAFASLTPLMATGAGAAPSASQAGVGLATAQATKVDPKAGGLSIGIAFGQSTANHQNLVAKAVSTATNMGVVGTTLAAEGCDGSKATWAREEQPQPLVVDSRDDAAHDGEVADNHAFRQFAKATEDPYAEAVTTVGPMPMGPLGEIGWAVSKTSSGYVDGVREARATIDITSVNLFNVVRLSSLHWDVVHQSAGGSDKEGTFTIGAATINGQAVPTQDASAVLAAANIALEPLGLRLTRGEVHVTDDRVRIDPLALSVVPNATRDQVAGTLFDVTHQGREDLFDAILQKYCKAGTYISVFDIVVGSLTGAGEFVVSFGGAEASSGTTPENDFRLDLPPPGTLPGLYIPPVPPSTTLVPGTTVTSAGTPAAVVTTPATPGTPGTRHLFENAASRPYKGARGGALATVGLVTLGIVAVIAEGDRRKMRAAQRRVAEGAR